MRKVLSVFLIGVLFSLSVLAVSSVIKVDFDSEKGNKTSSYFASIVGLWHLDRDGDNIVYAVDGRKWARGTMSSGVAEKAKLLYGERYAEFLDNVQAYKYFPLTVFKGIENFTGGEISVRFKGISGRIDQGAGIAFDIKKNGDYLVIRANPLENNLVLFRLKNGRRSVVKWIRNVKTPSKVWHTLKVVIDGRKVYGYLNGKLYLTYTNKTPISGRIGLWSKADSYVFFDDFTVKPLKKVKTESKK
ncbi:conserved hypothetical protein [Thermotomaculum hydrothermale]|uniref:3-keto-disaccharide hydrolase domain-containing protein n=1 Tax=Thermotomaculum hydrothermale TaxID=981385 RepID=A0A7R6SZB2_9BACT|nr:hypothetical protein [Thermotomaculum hydrothermale]BBB33466.1 conserved hypothetical protein [Thermotomaculum hydrothermale]